MLLRRPSSARRLLAFAGLAAASVTLAACAPQDSKQTSDLTGTQGEVQDVVQKLADRADDGNSAAICRELFTAKLQAALAKGGTCADNLEKAIDNSDYTSLNVRTVRLSASNGAQAQAIVRTLEDDGDRQINLVKGSGGKWQIDSFKNKVTPASDLSTTPTDGRAPSSTPATTGN